ncbi:SMI1/KNR4 family protein [Candidatus Clostridium radicumherbarum]|uniref:SMI1/KNR4 family protein n=1 Tax=Candidatus Clostridium radicumherbarum TaxID=3381662 RepID=A0ABW8TTI7_9CLOT
MKNKFEKYVSDVELSMPTSIEIISETENKLGIKFPSDYIEFMLFSNGCEGTIGESYISIWPIEELIDTNENLEVEKYTPGLVLFGSDGGGEAFAFDMRGDTIKYIMVPYMLEFDALIEQGNTIFNFFDRLNNGLLFAK